MSLKRKHSYNSGENVSKGPPDAFLRGSYCNMTENLSQKALVGLSDIISYNGAL